MTNNNDVTVCLTSCDRFDLLEKTVDSFCYLNSYPISRFIITEDSGKRDVYDKIVKRYGHSIEIIFNQKNLGPFISIDNMYNMCNTEYIFHCEDDWEFDRNANKDFIKNSIDILEERKDIHQVWIRKSMEFALEKDILRTSTDVKYRIVTQNPNSDWCGFSNNPGIRRKSDYIKFFPNGYKELIVPLIPGQITIAHTELACSAHVKNKGYKAASLVNTVCTHIGGDRSTQNNE